MRKKGLHIILHTVAWSAIYLLPFLITYGKINPGVLFGDPGGVVHVASTALLIGYAYFNHYLLVPKFYLHRRFILYGLLVTSAAMVVIWLPNILHPIEVAIRKSVLPEGLEFRRGGHRSDAGLFKLSYNIILFVICTFASISIRQQRQLLEVQKEKLNAELSFLKAQINPHFLFNTLNSIYALSIQKSDDTPRALIQVSELMRYILKDAEADVVPLNKEINYINNYVALQKRRLGHTVKINYEAPSQIPNKTIAPLILTSFVENAFKHGVNPEQDSAIHISISVRENKLKLLVTNNKVSSVNKEDTLGIGLKNAVSRLEHIYPGRHELTIENSDKSFNVQLIIELND